MRKPVATSRHGSTALQLGDSPRASQQHVAGSPAGRKAVKTYVGTMREEERSSPSVWALGEIRRPGGVAHHKFFRPKHDAVTHAADGVCHAVMRGAANKVVGFGGPWYLTVQPCGGRRAHPCFLGRLDPPLGFWLRIEWDSLATRACGIGGRRIRHVLARGFGACRVRAGARRPRHLVRIGLRRRGGTKTRFRSGGTPVTPTPSDTKSRLHCLG